MKTYSEYTRERNEMLKSCSVHKFRDFVVANHNFYPKGFVNYVCLASDDVILVTIHKMRVNADGLAYGLKRYSRLWLAEHGFSADIK